MTSSRDEQIARDLGAHLIEGALGGSAVSAGLGLWVFARTLPFNTLGFSEALGLGLSVIVLYAVPGVFMGALAAAIASLIRQGRGRGYAFGASAVAILLGAWVLRGRLDAIASVHLESLIGFVIAILASLGVGRLLRRRGAVATTLAWVMILASSVWIAKDGAHLDQPRDPDALEALRASRAPEHPLVVIGLDGVEPEILAEMRNAGMVEHLDRLWNAGATANIRSLEPTWSPPIWTTMWTGRLPRDHGITFFLSEGTFALPGSTAEVVLPRIFGLQRAAKVVLDERIVPVTSELRRATTVWEAAGLAGRNSVLANRLVSWPAQPIRGVEFSNRLLMDGAGLSNLAYPDSFASVARARVEASVPLADPDLAAAPWLAIELAKERALWTLAAETAVSAAEPTDLVVLYTHLIDSAQHRYLKYHWADRYRFTPDPANVDRFGEAIRATYRAVDAMIGEVLGILGPEYRVLLVSDHGVRVNRNITSDLPEPVGARRMPPAPLDEVSGVHGDAPDGVFCLVGPGIRPGLLPEAPGVLEVAPLILHLLGLPIPEDLERGSPLVRTPDLVEGLGPTRTVQSFEGLLPRRIRTQSSAADEEILDQLRSLGYIE